MYTIGTIAQLVPKQWTSWIFILVSSQILFAYKYLIVIRELSLLHISVSSWLLNKYNCRIYMIYIKIAMDDWSNQLGATLTTVQMECQPHELEYAKTPHYKQSLPRVDEATSRIEVCQNPSLQAVTTQSRWGYIAYWSMPKPLITSSHYPEEATSRIEVRQNPSLQAVTTQRRLHRVLKYAKTLITISHYPEEATSRIEVCQNPSLQAVTTQRRLHRVLKYAKSPHYKESLPRGYTAYWPLTTSSHYPEEATPRIDQCTMYIFPAVDSFSPNFNGIFIWPSFS